MNKITKAAVVSAALALLAQGAYAQQVNSGDLALGFTGNANSPAHDYILDLGSLATLNASPLTITDLSSQLSLTTFNQTFASITGTSVGAVEGVGNGVAGDNVAYGKLRSGSTAEGVQGSETTPTKITSHSTITSAAGQVNGLFTGTPATSGNPNTFAAESVQGTAGTIASDVSASIINTIGSSGILALDIFGEVRQSGSGQNSTGFVYEGQLDLNLSAYNSSSTGTAAAGTLEYIPAGFTPTSAVPEPTTYGVLAGAGLLVLGLRRQFARA
jgi:hypothetical protein